MEIRNTPYNPKRLKYFFKNKGFLLEKEQALQPEKP